MVREILETAAFVMLGIVTALVGYSLGGFPGLVILTVAAIYGVRRWLANGRRTQDRECISEEPVRRAVSAARKADAPSETSGS